MVRGCVRRTGQGSTNSSRLSPPCAAAAATMRASRFATPRSLGARATSSVIRTSHHGSHRRRACRSRASRSGSDRAARRKPTGWRSYEGGDAVGAPGGVVGSSSHRIRTPAGRTPKVGATASAHGRSGSAGNGHAEERAGCPNLRGYIGGRSVAGPSTGRHT